MNDSTPTDLDLEGAEAGAFGAVRLIGALILFVVLATVLMAATGTGVAECGGG